jgi:hypothetical protein
MKGIGALTGKVGATEIYARKRQASASDRYTTGFERGKEQFGATFFENEVGKDVMSGFIKNMQSGTDVAAKTMAIQLAGYVSDGIMSAEQAHSVASQIGINLNNTTLTSQISGQLLDLIGPSGEDLLKNPLEVRVKLVEEQRDLTKQLGSNFASQMEKDTNAFSRDNLLGSIGTMIPGGQIVQSILSGSATGKGYNFAEAFTQTDSEKMAASSAARGTQDLEFNQSQIDSLNAQYDKEVKAKTNRR